MSGIPGSVYRQIGNDSQVQPNGLQSLNYPGLPGGRLTSGAGVPNVSNVLKNSGINGLEQSHTGRHTSSMDPISQPILQINNQYMMDLTHMRKHDTGDMEFTWLDMDSGVAGSGEGQNKQYCFRSLSMMNQLFQTEAHRREFGGELSTTWFSRRWAMCGVMRHHDPDKETANLPDHCQLFNSAGQSRIKDVFQCAMRRGERGPDAGDDCWFILRNYAYKDELSRLGLSNATDRLAAGSRYWQLVPAYAKCREAIPENMLLDVERQCRGRAWCVCRVVHIYFASSGSRGEADSFVFNAHEDGSHQAHGLKLRQLDVTLQLT